MQKAKRINNMCWLGATRPGVSLLLLAGLLLPALVVSAKTPFKKKTKSAPVAKKAPAPRRTKAAPVQRARAAAPVVVAPAAVIPEVVQPASLWQGCLHSGEVSELAARLQVEENELRSALTTREMMPLSEGSACVPYAGATGGERGATTALFQGRVTDGANPSLLLVSHTADFMAITGRPFQRPEPAQRIVSMPGRDFADRPAELMAFVPDAVRWQIDILVPQMLPAGNDYTVRIGFGKDPDGEHEHLHSIEIVETSTGKLVDGAWWVHRNEGPGVFVGLKGTAYERSLWLSPIAYVRKSRGVGPTSNTVRRNFAAPKGKPGAKVTRIVTLRGFHIGVDLTAPTGTPIHTVGDGVVSFVGRRGGYGNLVIVDHGRGYQTYYAHMSAFQKGVKAGTPVVRGELLGRVGSTGRSTAPHLHFETRKDSKYIDPYDESRQLEFWMLTPEEHERLAVRLLAGVELATPAPVVVSGGGDQ